MSAMLARAHVSFAATWVGERASMVAAAGAALDAKVAALVAHRTQYALDAELLPRQVLGPLLGTEHSTVVG